MQRGEQLGIGRAARKSGLNHRRVARRLPRRDTDDQDGQITRKHGELDVAIETGKTQIQNAYSFIAILGRTHGVAPRE